MLDRPVSRANRTEAWEHWAVRVTWRTGGPNHGECRDAALNRVLRWWYYADDAVPFLPGTEDYAFGALASATRLTSASRSATRGSTVRSALSTFNRGRIYLSSTSAASAAASTRLWYSATS